LQVNTRKCNIKTSNGYIFAVGNFFYESRFVTGEKMWFPNLKLWQIRADWWLIIFSLKIWFWSCICHHKKTRLWFFHTIWPGLLSFDYCCQWITK